MFERDGLLDSLNREGLCNVWELVAQGEWGLKRFHEREVSWPARYARKGCLSSVLYNMHPAG